MDPVSAAILERIDDYRGVLEDYSRPLLPLIEWEATPDNNVRALNDTADYDCFFDATPHAEFLYACVKRTIDQDLPRETEFLRRFDRFRARVQNIIEMPGSPVDLLFRFLRRNDGRLSQRRPENEFAQLTDEETNTEPACPVAFGDAR